MFKVQYMDPFIHIPVVAQFVALVAFKTLKTSLVNF